MTGVQTCALPIYTTRPTRPLHITAASMEFHSFTKDQLFALARAQRGAPEEAMLRLQSILGGGVMNVVVEHMGDLIHRMCERPTFETAGYEAMAEKVKRGLRYLEDRYGFEREYQENMKANAEHRVAQGKYASVGEYYAFVTSAEKEYVNAHSKLVPLNAAQYTARAIPMCVGMGHYSLAIGHLYTLKDKLKSVGEWVLYAHEGLIN